MRKKIELNLKITLKYDIITGKGKQKIGRKKQNEFAAKIF